MADKDGLEYAHNYDVVVKWLAEAFQGKTLAAIGVETGHIVDVFGFEPVDISVREGRVDVMFRDDRQKLYHLEEQRNLRKTDMFRFAAHYFMGAGKWGTHVTDIVLASGEVYRGDKTIVTDSGTYTPLVVDFSERDGFKRLAEIRKAIDEGTFENYLELVFLPLYGKETGQLRVRRAEDTIRLQAELYRAQKISSRLLGATLIMANKTIDKDRLQEIWEEIKMLDILEVAHEKGKNEGIEEGKSLGIEEGRSLGIEEGKSLGIEEGEVLGMKKGLRDTLKELIVDKYDNIPEWVLDKIDEIDKINILKTLFSKALKCDTLEKFEKILDLY